MNVAGVVGSIRATVNSLQSSGAEKVAEALRALADSIVADATLSGERKAEALGHVSAIGEEIAKPPEQRRPGLVRTVAGGLVAVISQSEKVYAGYEILKTVAKASGYELP